LTFAVQNKFGGATVLYELYIRKLFIKGEAMVMEKMGMHVPENEKKEK
jgi:hypothetical protein